MTTAETEWDEEQQGLILALQAWRDTRCKRCGGDLRETTSPEMEDGYRALDPLCCWRCWALAGAEDKHRKSSHPHALLHRAEKKPPRRKPA